MIAARPALPKYAYLLIVALLAGLAWQHTATVTLDDAYITYRYAENLAQSGRLVYNETGPSQLFATTAPAYAVLLAAFGALDADIPTVGGWLGILSMIVAALALADLLAGWFPWGGLLAGALLALLPMSWLVLGMEGLPALALALLGLALSRRDHDAWAALALAAATLLRFDGAAAALAWGIWLLARAGWRSPKVWRAAAIYLVAVVAVYGALMLFFGVPLPATLGAKRAQVSLGITGFYSDTNYLEGLWLLARAYWEHSPWYAVIALLAATGLGTLLLALRTAEGRRWVLTSPFFALLLWTAFHLLLYAVLGVTPYVWYYLPVAPLLASLAALGVAAIARVARQTSIRPVRDFVPLAFCAALVVGPLATHRLIDERAHAAAQGAAAPGQTLADKALPGTQYRAYRATGEWLAANTSLTATVGVTEVGIMGYFSRRPMLDFLGLLDEGVSHALARGNMNWGIYARQPDYVAFSSINPVYAYNPYEDPWFQTNHTPEQSVPASGFWGGDMTIYRRNTPALPYGEVDAVPPSATPLGIRFGDQFELVAVEARPGPWRGGEAAGTTFYWRALKQPDRDYARFAHLVDGDGRMIAGHDNGALFDERPTSTWQPGKLYADFEPFGLPSLPVAPTPLVWEVGLHVPEEWRRLPAFGLDGAEMPGGQAQFPAPELLPASEPVVLADDDCRVEIGGYQLERPTVLLGGETKLMVDVSDATCPVALIVDVWDWIGSRTVWEGRVDVAAPGQAQYAITTWEGDPATWPSLRIRAEIDGKRLRVLDSAGHTLGDTLTLTPVELAKP